MALINKKAVRVFLLEFALRNRAHKFCRVSPSVYDQVEAMVREACRKIVQSQPSSGKTIK